MAKTNRRKKKSGAKKAATAVVAKLGPLLCKQAVSLGTKQTGSTRGPSPNMISRQHDQIDTVGVLVQQQASQSLAVLWVAKRAPRGAEPSQARVLPHTPVSSQLTPERAAQEIQKRGDARKIYTKTRRRHRC